MIQLCNAVSDQILSHKGLQNMPDDGAFLPEGQGFYDFEARMWARAGVMPSDTPEQVRDKMQRYWLTDRSNMGCTQLGFSIKEGNVMKLAIERNSKHVVNDFIRRWNLDMNFIDPADGKTVLDYTEAELVKNRGTPIEPTLQRYRDLLVRTGAKHASEL
jgi:hypothetical protein